MWRFLSSFKQSDLIEGLDVRRETTVNAENFSFYDSTKTEVIKDVHTVLPSVGITILTHIFIIKSIYSRNLACFVVTSEDCYMSWISEF